ncbi:MAG: hypothetical protein IKS54_07980 [Erysipelotrichaceae bacterium]|nr:hypothetical protein [Erysipelotrichaceae bacterium]
MYHDSYRKTLLKIIAALCVCVLAFSAYSSFRSRSEKDLSEESAEAIKEAIEHAALQCYVIEGAYPVNLEYLKENYGLTINEKNYYVVYNAFAENQLPDIRIVRK